MKHHLDFLYTKNASGSGVLVQTMPENVSRPQSQKTKQYMQPVGNVCTPEPAQAHRNKPRRTPSGLFLFPPALYAHAERKEEKKRKQKQEKVLRMCFFVVQLSDGHRPPCARTSSRAWAVRAAPSRAPSRVRVRRGSSCCCSSFPGGPRCRVGG